MDTITQRYAHWRRNDLAPAVRRLRRYVGEHAVRSCLSMLLGVGVLTCLLCGLAPAETYHAVVIFASFVDVLLMLAVTSFVHSCEREHVRRK